MSALSNAEISRAILLGGIVIDGFLEECVRPSSYLLRLSSELLVRSGDAVLIDTRSTDTNKLFRRIEMDDSGYVLEPNVLHIGRSVELLALGAEFCGDLGLLSCYARIGLSLNLGSSQVAATFGRRGPSALAFEIINTSKDSVVIYPGVKLCHIRIFRHELPATISYEGIYASGDSITPADFSRKPAK